MKKMFLILISLLLISNLCFANYTYDLFFDKDNKVFMCAPSHWRQLYPGIVGNSKILLDIKSPDEKGSAMVRHELEILPYDSLSKLSERDRSLLALSDIARIKEKYPTAECLDVNVNAKWANLSAITSVTDATFPTGKYRYFTVKFVYQRKLYSIVIMAHSYLLSSIDVERMINSVYVGK